MIGRSGWLVAVAVLVGAPAAAGAPSSEYAPGVTYIGLRVGGGVQNHLPRGHEFYTGLEYLSWMPQVSTFPWAPMGEGKLRGIPEVGVELMIQRYEAPDDLRGTGAYGMKGALRYHFLDFGTVVPYLEATAGMAATDLRIREIRSSFTFVLEAGVGVSVPVGGGRKLSLGYRFHHLSNGGLERPNRGINADSALLGLSFPLR